MKKRLLMFGIGLLSACFCLPALAEESSGEQLSMADQQKRITGNVSEWKPENGTGSYVITDLDGNGRLEIISANYNDETLETEARMWEISEEGKFTVCQLPWKDGDSQPDLITDAATVYYDTENDLYYYIFEDASVAEDGSEKVQTVALSFKDQVLTSELLETDAVEERFEGMEQMEAKFRWVSTAEHSLGSDVPMEQILTLVEESYAGFSLQKAEQ